MAHPALLLGCWQMLFSPFSCFPAPSPPLFVNLANLITLLRLALIPVFVGCAIRHGQIVANGSGDQTWRWISVVVLVWRR